MAEIINFPDKNARDRADIEIGIREALTEGNLSPLQIDTLLSNISGFIEILAGMRYSFSVNISTTDINAVNQQAILFESQSNAFLNRLTDTLIKERVTREINHLLETGII
jgi:hypothetical protein